MSAWAEHTDHKALLRQVLPSIGQWRHRVICLHLGFANADMLSASIPHWNWHRLEIYTVSSHQQNSVCHCISFHLKNWFKLQLQQETCWYTSANKKAYSIINKLHYWAPVWLLLHIHSALRALCFFSPNSYSPNLFSMILNGAYSRLCFSQSSSWNVIHSVDTVTLK